MAAVTRLGLHGGPRGLYGDFTGKTAGAVQMSGTTGFAWTPSGALDVEATLAGSTGWDTNPTGALDALGVPGQGGVIQMIRHEWTWDIYEE